MVHLHPTSENITARSKIESLGTRDQKSSILSNNKDIYAEISHWKYQSLCTCHYFSKVFHKLTTSTAKSGKEVGTTAPPSQAQRGPLPLDKDSPMGHKKGVQINKIVFTTPTVTLWSDSCNYGIGGYNDKVIAWQWRIPTMCHCVLVINLI